jgi:4-oxalocrotonate tautomerase
MPLVRVSIPEGKTSNFKKSLSEGIHQAMAETINVPHDDRFQIFSDHKPGDLVADPAFLGIKRTADVVFIQITLNAGRSVELKKKLYARIAELLSHDPGLRPEDIVINLLEVAKENWSFGNGQAPFAP